MRVKILHNECQLNFRKWSLSLVLLSLLLTAIPMHAENNIPAERISIEEAFTLIGIEYGVHFNYDRAVVSDVEVDYESGQYEKVEDALQSVFSQTHLKYEIFDQRYVAVYRQDREGVESMKKMVSHFQEVISSSENAIQRSERRITPPLTSLSMKDIFSKRLVFNVSGTVTDQDGEPLIGVNIQVKGSNKGTATDFDGHFTLEDIDENAILVISYVGYQTQEVGVSGKSNLSITLSSDSQLLDEVVVVGYGTRERGQLTGSVSSIQGEDLQRSPSVNLASSLQGLLPGTTALQSTGEPGRNKPSVRIRGLGTTGNTDPLVVVDGVPSNSDWQYINSNDVASISVLKDASAAIYGARAANGVILITTKRGMEGKPTINYSFNQGFSIPTMVPKPADSYHYAQYVNQLAERDNQPPLFDQSELEKFRTGSDPENYPNVNWYDIVLKNVSPQSKHNLNMRGGDDKIRYSISGSFSNENSIFQNGSLNFKTYSIRSNLDANVNQYIKVGLDLNAGMNDGNYPNYGVSTVMHSLLAQQPWQPPYWPNGLPTPGLERGENPAFMVSEESGNINNLTKNFMGKASIDVSLPWIEGMEINGFFAYIDNNSTTKNWKKTWTVYDYDRSNDEYIPRLGGGVLLPQLTQSLNNGVNKLLNIRLSYKKEIAQNRFEAFIAGEQEEGISSNFSAFRRDYISESIDELFAGNLDDQKADGSKSISGRQSLFSRLSYSYNNKYLIDFNIRYDGSSVFAPGRRFGLFPGASLAWQLGEEKFMKSIEILDLFKIRASYGQIGNDRINAFQYLTLYNINGGYTIGGSVNQGLVAGVTPNPEVTWEVAKQSNIGFDALLWNGFFGITLDLFKHKRSNILTTRDAAIPAFANLSLPNENIGEVENKGIELDLSSTNYTGDWTYRVGLNFAYNKSRIIDISEPTNVPDWQKKEGHMIGATRYYKAVGIFRTEDELENEAIYSGTKVGDLKYEDIDGDGIITSNDMVIQDKTNIPQITYGFNFSVQYNNFSLAGNFAGYAKVWQSYHFYARNSQNSLSDVIENRYVPGSMDSKYPILPTIEGTSSSEVSGLQSDFWLYNTSYLRLKTLEFSYQIPSRILDRFKISNMNVFVNGDNLLTISKFKLFDPANTHPNGFYYPLMSVYNVGLDLQF